MFVEQSWYSILRQNLPYWNANERIIVVAILFVYGITENGKIENKKFNFRIMFTRIRKQSSGSTISFANTCIIHAFRKNKATYLCKIIRDWASGI